MLAMAKQRKVSNMKGCVLFIFIIAFLGMGAPSWADKTHTVKKGDTLYRISKKYKTDIGTITQANELDSDKLVPGTKLIIPSGASPVIQPFVDAKTGEEAAQTYETTETKKETPEEFLMFVARQTLGIPYKFGSSSNRATDCSGYVQRVFSFMGIHLPRSAREQFNHGVSVDKRNLSIGDLVFFRTYALFPSHVGIYLGNNLFVHASAYAKKVTIDSLETPYYIKRFIGAKRLPGFDELDLSGAAKIPGPVLR